MTVDRSRFRKKLVGPYTGQEYQVRRVSIGEFMNEMGGLAIQQAPTLEKQLQEFGEKMQEKRADPEAEKNTLEFFLGRGVVSPKIFFGEESQCPDDQIPVADLGQEANWLVEKIFTLSYSLANTIPDHFFFRPGTDHPGRAGEAILPETVGLPAAANDS